MTKNYPLIVILGSLTLLTTLFSFYVQAHKLSHGTLALLIDQYHTLWFWLILNMGFVFFWRGAWGLLDLVVFPENLLKSYTFSFAVGMFLLGIAIFLGRTEFPV